MSMMHDELRQRLQLERDRLVLELEQVQANGQESLGYSTHQADDASAAFDQARDLALRGNLERTLQQVEQALGRFVTGTYGVCEACGQTIDPARLRAIPHAVCCLDCQRRMEH